MFSISIRDLVIARETGTVRYVFLIKNVITEGKRIPSITNLYQFFLFKPILFGNIFTKGPVFFISPLPVIIVWFVDLLGRSVLIWRFENCW